MRALWQGHRAEPVLRPDAFSFWASWAQLPHLFTRTNSGGRGEGSAGASPALGSQPGRIDPEIGWTTTSDCLGPNGELW